MVFLLEPLADLQVVGEVQVEQVDGSGDIAVSAALSRKKEGVVWIVIDQADPPFFCPCQRFGEDLHAFEDPDDAWRILPV